MLAKQTMIPGPQIRKKRLQLQVPAGCSGRTCCRGRDSLPGIVPSSSGILSSSACKSWQESFDSFSNGVSSRGTMFVLCRFEVPQCLSDDLLFSLISCSLSLYHLCLSSRWKAGCKFWENIKSRTKYDVCTTTSCTNQKLAKTEAQKLRTEIVTSSPLDWLRLDHRHE